MPRISKIPRIAFTASVLVALVFAVTTVQGVPDAEALTNCSVSDSFDSQEQAFLQLINQYRSQNGRTTLTASVNLNRGSAWMARDMATKNYFSHTDSLGRSVSTRLSNCDATPSFGENIAAGTYRDTAQEAFDAWKASSGHNANMLNGSYKQIGIARYYDANSRYKWYWVTDFSTSNDGTNAGGSSGGSSGGTTNPPPPTATAAVMTSPANGSTLPAFETTFRWTAVSGASQYYIYMGTSPGSNNMVSASLGTATSVTIRGYPSSGALVYVRLWTRVNSTWYFNDYSYRLP
jgi:uncharacterized protein YkwD